MAESYPPPDLPVFTDPFEGGGADPVMSSAPGEPGPLPHEAPPEPDTQSSAVEGVEGAGGQAPSLTLAEAP